LVCNAGPGLEEVNKFISVTGILTCQMTEGSKKMDSNMARKGCGICIVLAFSWNLRKARNAQLHQHKSIVLYENLP
jgi:hypothetical protein